MTRVPWARHAWSCKTCGFTYLIRSEYREHWRRTHGTARDRMPYIPGPPAPVARIKKVS